MSDMDLQTKRHDNQSNLFASSCLFCCSIVHTTLKTLSHTITIYYYLSVSIPTVYKKQGFEYIYKEKIYMFPKKSRQTNNIHYSHLKIIKKQRKLNKQIITFLI